jgi:hypothetical protein
MTTTVDPDAAKTVIPCPTIRAPGSAHTAVFCAQGMVTFAYAHSFLFGDLCDCEPLFTSPVRTVSSQGPGGTRARGALRG